MNKLFERRFLKRCQCISAISGSFFIIGSFLYNYLEYETYTGIGNLSIAFGFLMVISKALFRFLPERIDEYFTNIGALLIMGGYLYNILLNKFIFEARDIPALIGFSLVQLGILLYIVSYSFDYIESQQHMKINR